jgi:hypothetical protein
MHIAREVCTGGGGGFSLHRHLSEAKKLGLLPSWGVYLKIKKFQYKIMKLVAYVKYI